MSPDNTESRCNRALGGKECIIGEQMNPSQDDVNRAIGNVLDRWEQLPNDLRSDPGFEALDNALIDLYNVIMERMSGSTYE